MVSKKQMISFICGNVTRYPYLNPWSNRWSFGINVKVHSLPLTPGQRDEAYGIVFTHAFAARVNGIIAAWETMHPDLEAGFDGRMSGWLILSRVESRPYYYSEEELGGMEKKEVAEVYSDVRAFKQLYDALLKELRFCCDHFTVKEETEYVPRKTLVMEKK